MKPRRVDNPPNPWAESHVEWIGQPPPAPLVVYEEQARQILSENQSPDLPFRFGLNPYRGCVHGCIYCYARPTHQYLDFGAGTDFERRIVVKTNAAECLARRLDSPRWEPETIVFSGVTDCYQPLEVSYEVTRQCLEVLGARKNPVGFITKSALIRRDIDLLGEMADWGGLRVFISIPFADDATGWAIEPQAAAISQRFKTIKILADAGVDMGVSIAPLIPGLNASDVPEILARAAEAGASRAFMTLLRLPRPVDQIFEQRLRQAFPDRVDRVLSALDDMRDGKRQEGRFGHRMRGGGPRWQAVHQLFKKSCDRLGLSTSRDGHLNRDAFCRGGQQSLW